MILRRVTVCLAALLSAATGGATANTPTGFEGYKGIAPPFVAASTTASCDSLTAPGSCATEASADAATGAGRVRVFLPTEGAGAANTIFEARHVLPNASAGVSYVLIVRFLSAQTTADQTPVEGEAPDMDPHDPGEELIQLHYEAEHECGCAGTTGFWTLVGDGVTLKNEDVVRPFEILRTDGATDPIPAGRVTLKLDIQAIASSIAPGEVSIAEGDFVIKKLGFRQS